MKHKWHFSKSGRKNCYRLYVRNSEIGMIHRLIMGNPDVKKDIDHINGNTTDNRKKNLRVCTREQNSWNRKIPITNTSGYKHVLWDNQKRSWIAAVRVKGKTYVKICKKGKKEAIKQAKIMRNKYQGKFAKYEYQ